MNRGSYFYIRRRIGSRDVKKMQSAPELDTTDPTTKTAGGQDRSRTRTMSAGDVDLGEVDSFANVPLEDIECDETDDFVDDIHRGYPKLISGDHESQSPPPAYTKLTPRYPSLQKTYTTRDGITYSMLTTMFLYLMLLLIVQLYGSPASSFIYRWDTVLNQTAPQSPNQSFYSVEMSMVYTAFFGIAATITAFTVVSRPMWFDEKLLLEKMMWIKHAMHCVLLMGTVLLSVGIVSTTAHLFGVFVVICVYMAPVVMSRRGLWIIVPLVFIVLLILYVIVCSATNALAVGIYCLIRTQGVRLTGTWLFFYIVTFIVGPLVTMASPYVIYSLPPMGMKLHWKVELAAHTLVELAFMFLSIFTATFTTIIQTSQ